MYSKDLKEKIYVARRNGMSWNQLSTTFTVPRSTCRKICKEYGNSSSQPPKNNQKVKGNIKKRIIMGLKSLDSCGSCITSQKVLEKSRVNVSARTVQRFLKNEGYKYMKIKKEIQLSEHQKMERKEFCLKWLIGGMLSKNIIFTDETRYNLDGPDSEMSWQQPGNRRKKPLRQQADLGNVDAIGSLELLRSAGKHQFIKIHKNTRRLWITINFL